MTITKDMIRRGDLVDKIEWVTNSLKTIENGVLEANPDVETDRVEDLLKAILPEVQDVMNAFFGDGEE